MSRRSRTVGMSLCDVCETPLYSIYSTYGQISICLREGGPPQCTDARCSCTDAYIYTWVNLYGVTLWANLLGTYIWVNHRDVYVCGGEPLGCLHTVWMNILGFSLSHKIYRLYKNLYFDNGRLTWHLVRRNMSVDAKTVMSSHLALISFTVGTMPTDSFYHKDFFLLMLFMEKRVG